MMSLVMFDVKTFLSKAKILYFSKHKNRRMQKHDHVQTFALSRVVKDEIFSRCFHNEKQHLLSV